MSKLLGDIKLWKWKDCNEKLNMFFTVMLKKSDAMFKLSMFLFTPPGKPEKKEKNQWAVWFY